VKLAIAGAAGRMGRALIEALGHAKDLTLAAALEASGHPQLGKDAGDFIGVAIGVRLTADVAAGVATSDCLIDFTKADGALEHLAACVRSGKRAVIGTTGFTVEQKAEITAAAQRIPIVLSPNFAVGVNVAFKLAEEAARALGDSYDVEIIEAHHRHKIDAPSGTALRLGETIAAALGRDLKTCAVYGRRGITGEREAKTIAFHAIRGGDIVGEHTVIFAGEGERVEIAVRSASRMTYAHGALRAARWLEGKSPGLYDMADVIGLSRTAARE